MSFVSGLVRLGRSVVVAGAVLLVGAGAAAQAGTIAINFSGLTDGASNSAVQAKVQSAFGAQATVAVTGAVGEVSYNGDGHVVGPGTGGTSYSLSNYNIQATALYGSTQAFIMNNQGQSSNAGDPHSNNVVFKIAGGLTVTGISFNYEIFPDAANPAGNPPDFIFGTNKNANVVTQLGVNPGTAGTYSANWKHSPASGSSANETFPQYLGYYTNSNLGAGVTTLYFNDWPAEIGVNNITLTTYSTPEPASCTLLLVGSGSLAVYGRMKRRAVKA
jgi:hypothetical protein